MEKTSGEAEAADRLAMLIELYAIEKCCLMAAQLGHDDRRAAEARARVADYRRAIRAAGVPL